MSENESLSFRTKTGTCEITPDQIILTRSGVRGQVARLIFGSSIQRAVMIYGVLALLALVFTVVAVVEGDMVGIILFGALALLCGLNAVDARRKSASPIIERKSIRRVQAHPPHAPVTRGYFNVEFEEQGVTRQRLIILPGSLEDGNAEFQRALEILRQAGLPVEP